MCYITHLFYRKISIYGFKRSRIKRNSISSSNQCKRGFSSFIKKELEDILGLFEELNAAETSEISAMSHPLDLSQPTRQDEVTEENLREELLKNAPSVQSGLFLVPKVIEGEE